MLEGGLRIPLQSNCTKATRRISSKDMTKQAKSGKYLVIGTDTFPWPHEDYALGEYSTLEKAKRVAKAEERRGGSMTCVSIYDDSGELLYSTPR